MPEGVGPGALIGVSEDMIRTVVARFYAKVRSDGLLAPLFEARVDDWDEHLVKLQRFWSSVVLMTGRYKGTPMQAHLDLPAIDDAHFSRWLALFEETLSECCSPDQAALFSSRARRIAESFKMAIAIKRGAMPTPFASPKEIAPCPPRASTD